MIAQARKRQKTADDIRAYGEAKRRTTMEQDLDNVMKLGTDTVLVNSHGELRTLGQMGLALMGGPGATTGVDAIEPMDELVR